ncbi:MAG: ABC transporter permease [Bacteriovoracaceae bacterium]
MKHFWKKSNTAVRISLIIAFIFLAIAIFAPLITPHSPNELYNDALKLPPIWSEGGTSTHILGTDDVGRDQFSRLAYGARISFVIGLGVVFIATVLGSFLGLLSGFYGDKVDFVIMRFTDILMALPSILLAIVIVSLLGPGLINTMFAVAIVSLPTFIRLVRASVLEQKARDYVQAAHANGATSFRIMLKEIFPNAMAPIIVQASLGFSEAVLSAAALGFLGLGVQPPTPEWGTMLADARGYIESAPWLVTLPGVCILLIVVTFNLIGDGLRDFLDPRMKGR